MKQEEKKQGPAMPDTFWDDWRMATAAIKGVAVVPPKTLKRWAKETEAWRLENTGGMK